MGSIVTKQQVYNALACPISHAPIVVDQGRTDKRLQLYGSVHLPVMYWFEDLLKVL
jgi:hypothetical protein